ncbi:hypothetical protein MTO96_003095 [Rhipicephalus appendiculatus]
MPQVYVHPPAIRDSLPPAHLTFVVPDSVNPVLDYRLRLGQGCTVLDHVTSRASSPGAPPGLRLDAGSAAFFHSTIVAGPSPVYIPGTPPRRHARRPSVRGLRAASGAVTSAPRRFV